MKFVVNLVEDTGCMIILFVSASSLEEAKEKALAYYKEKALEPENVTISKVVDVNNDDTIILAVF